MHLPICCEAGEGYSTVIACLMSRCDNRNSSNFTSPPSQTMKCSTVVFIVEVAREDNTGHTCGVRRGDMCCLVQFTRFKRLRRSRPSTQSLHRTSEFLCPAH